MLAKIINKILYPFDIKITRPNRQSIYPAEATKRDIEIMKYILRPDNPRERISMVSVDRFWSVLQSTKYILKNNIKGDFVECGVWRGGCSLAIAMLLNDLGSEKKIFLFDTFTGMAEPGEFDINWKGDIALDKYKKKKKATHTEWVYSSLEDVMSQFKKLGLEKNAVFVKGDVLKTLKQETNLPKNIALLRLDTDFYESTKFELEILYPKLQKHGILLVDDYGWWKGSKKAVDEYFEKNNQDSYPLLWKIDYSGRGLIKN